MISSGKHPILLDSNVFTFRPKVSSASVKIVENLGTNFMARQQEHLQRQRKHVEQATLHFRTYSGRLSPVNSIRVKRSKDKLVKENEENSNHNSALDSETNAELQNLESSSPQQPEAEYEDTYPIENSETMPPLNRTKTLMSPGLQRILDGPYGGGNPDMVLKKQKGNLSPHQLKSIKPIQENMEDDERDAENELNLSRSKTMPSLGRPKLTRKTTTFGNGNTDRLKHAKEVAEKAIKQRKIFTIQGGYSAVRHSLRKRGWVEKFYRIPGPSKRSNRKRRRQADDAEDDNLDDSDDDDDDDDDGDDSDNDQPKVPPWEEDDGIYGIMSRIVRNINPTFIWVLKTNSIDYRFLTKEQMVNHYINAGSFTTKVGLSINMKNVPWFENADPESFFPRSYRLSHEDEKGSFIDDYRLTACVSILKIIMEHYMDGGECDEERREQGGGTDTKEPEKEVETEAVVEPESSRQSEQPAEVLFQPDSDPMCTNSECTRSRPNCNSENTCVHADPPTLTPPPPPTETKPDIAAVKKTQLVSTPRDKKNRKKKKKILVPLKALESAIQQCEKILICKEHDDIDLSEEPFKLTDAQWDELIHWYYQLAFDGGVIQNVPRHQLGLIETLLNRLKAKLPQFELNGTKNVWIVKPGAKSRGRGIVCYNRLEDMLKLVNSQVVRKDNKYVVQKYIERPLLVYNCKFDIRQWFLVTDWNPLTLWFYQDSYLRFCSQEYTLNNFDESIHLCNNAIQKYYKNGERSSELPDDNMWTHYQFKDFIRKTNRGDLWEELIYPGMKKAIICSLLATQDLIDYRKSSFELYGADFMLTEDYSPWLIEINSSPSMESSTAVTAEMCAGVLEDTIKVTLDRKFDRNCDIGRFELAYKQPVVTVPPYIGINLNVEGQYIRKPPGFSKRNTDSNQSLDISPRREFGKLIITNDKQNTDSSKSSSSCLTITKRPHSENQENTTFKHTTNSAPTKSYKSITNDVKESFIVKPRKSPSHYRTLHGVTVVSNNSNSNPPESVKPEEAEGTKAGPMSPHPPPSYLRPTFNSSFQNNPYLNSINGRRMVSRTSVSNSYSLPGMDGRERPTLAVNNVESTDLRTIKATRGRSPLMEGNWSRTCNDCGAGMNLYLENSNPFCKCRQDSIKMGFEDQTKSGRRVSPSRPRSSYSSSSQARGPSASASSRSIGLHGSNSNLHINNRLSPTGDKVLLRYTDGGIQRPVTPISVVTNPLPKLVRRYIGRKTMPCHDVGYPQTTTLYIDTSQTSNPLSIISPGVYR